MPEMSTEEKNIAQDIKNKIFDQVITCLREDLITHEHICKFILSQELIPGLSDFIKKVKNNKKN